VPTPQWEYIVRRWEFRGPDLDDWPRRDEYVAALEAQKSQRAQAEASARSANALGTIPAMSLRNWGVEEEVEGDLGERLAEAYLAWRDQAEVDLLNEFGDAGFEMISMTRQRRDERRDPTYVFYYAFPIIGVHCSFKRQKQVRAPEPPHREIGFRLPAT
jgi:hypothetical protein